MGCNRKKASKRQEMLKIEERRKETNDGDDETDETSDERKTSVSFC